MGHGLHCWRWMLHSGFDVELRHADLFAGNTSDSSIARIFHCGCLGLRRGRHPSDSDLKTQEKLFSSYRKNDLSKILKAVRTPLANDWPLASVYSEYTTFVGI